MRVCFAFMTIPHRQRTSFECCRRGEGGTYKRPAQKHARHELFQQKPNDSPVSSHTHTHTHTHGGWHAGPRNGEKLSTIKNGSISSSNIDPYTTIQFHCLPFTVSVAGTENMRATGVASIIICSRAAGIGWLRGEKSRSLVTFGCKRGRELSLRTTRSTRSGRTLQVTCAGDQYRIKKAAHYSLSAGISRTRALGFILA